MEWVPFLKIQFNKTNLAGKFKNDLVISSKTKCLFVLKERIRYNQYLFWNSIKMVYLDISNWIYSKSWTDKQSGLMVPKVILNYQRNEFDPKRIWNVPRVVNCIKLHVTITDLNKPFRNHALYRFFTGPMITVDGLKSLADCKYRNLRLRKGQSFPRVNSVRVLKSWCSISRKWYEVIPEESHGGFDT